MTDLGKKLLADLRWRLSAAGRRYRPNTKEQDSWAPFRIPFGGALLVWIAYLLFATLGAQQWLSLSPMVEFVLFAWPGWLASAMLIFNGRSMLNRLSVLRAYRRLLDNNERFALVEYNRYLSRRIKQAQEDSALGGPAEVARLKQLQGQFVEMLRQGLGREGTPLRSRIAEEAQFAEAYIESFRELSADPLAELDTRLPRDLMARVQELEREEATSNPAEKQVENQ